MGWVWLLKVGAALTHLIGDVVSHGAFIVASQRLVAHAERASAKGWHASDYRWRSHRLTRITGLNPAKIAS